VNRGNLEHWEQASLCRVGSVVMEWQIGGRRDVRIVIRAQKVVKGLV